MALIGLGEDTGGSIRVPSSFCGLVGLRATPGMISRKGLSPLLVPQGTPGPMCRTVTDAALMFDAMVGYDEADAYTATFVLAGRPEGGSYAANLTSDTMRRARLGVLRVQMLGADSDPDCAAVNAVINRALDTLASSGTQLVDIEIPDMEKSLFFTLIYGSRSRYDLDNFLSQRPHIKPNTMAEIQASGLYHKGLDLINTIAQSPVHPHQDPEYHLRMEERDKFQKQLIGILAKHQLDAFVFPDCKIAAPKLADILKPKWGLMDFPINTTLASNGWMPAITVPAGLTEGENLPVGLEMVGLPYQEQKLFQLAFGVEELVKGRKPPAL
jgi:amidase